MAYTPEFQKIKTSKRKNIMTQQNTIECKLPATDGSDIVRILSANCTAYIMSSEYDSGSVRYSGTAKFQVIYESQDGATFGLDYTAEFNDKVGYEQEIIPVISTSVVDVSATNSSSDVKIVAVVETTIDGIENMDTDVLVGAGEDNEMFVEREEQDFMSYLGQINEKVDISSDIEIKDEVAKVLTVSPVVSIMDTKVFDGYTAVSGEICVNITYYASGVVRSHVSSIPFSEEFAFEGLTENAKIMSNIFVGSDIVVSTTLDQDRAIVNVGIPVYYIGQVFDQVQVDMVVDVFSPQNEITLTTSSVESTSDIENIVTHEKIDGSLTINDLPFIDEVLGTSGSRVVVARAFVGDGELIVEGVANTTVLYLNKETNNTYSVDVEMPFSVSTRADGADTSSVAYNVSLCDVSAKSKRGKEIEVYAHLDVYASVYDTETFGVITDLNVGEEIPESNFGLTLYFVKENETLWDIAKELRVSPNSILEQNPNLELPLKPGDKIFVYRRINR